MNKICTDLEQSKKLIELGIDVYTADMYWKNGVSDKYFQCFTPFVGSGTDMDYDYDIPAWSLTALLELIPPHLGEFSEGIDFGFGKAMNGKWYSAHYLQFIKEDIKPFKTVTGETSVDAAFEMVCWLKENGKI